MYYSILFLKSNFQSSETLTSWNRYRAAGISPGIQYKIRQCLISLESIYAPLLRHASRFIYPARTCFLSEVTSGRFANLPNWRRKEGRERWSEAAGRDLRLPWKFNLKTRMYVNHPRETRRRIKGGTNWINVLSGALQDGYTYTTVGFKLKRPWSRHLHRSWRGACLSFSPLLSHSHRRLEGAANFF